MIKDRIIVALFSFAAVVMFISIINNAFPERTNTTGKVIHKAMMNPDNSDDSPYIIIIQREKETFAGRVPRAYFKSVKIGEHLLIIDLYGSISGHHHKTLLFDTQTVLTPITSKKTPTLHGNEFDSSLLYYLIYTPTYHIHSALNGGLVFRSRIALDLSETCNPKPANL